MRLGLGAVDDEIRMIETRIARERGALDEALHGCTATLRDAVTSPTALLALAGAGFVMGKLMFGRKDTGSAAVAKTGVLGLLTGVAGTVLSLTRQGSSLGTLGRWGLDTFLARRAAAKAAKSGAPPAGRSYLYQCLYLSLFSAYRNAAPCRRRLFYSALLS